jgi:2'-5' RNA ligase
MTEHGPTGPPAANRAAAQARLFFALWPDDAVREALARYAATVHRVAGGRATRPETLHLTLAFLGDTSLDRVPDLVAAASTVSPRPFALVLDRAAYWKHNRIVWAGAAEIPAALVAMVDELRGAVAAAGFRFDPKPFVVHATLIRNGAPRGPLPVFAPIEWRGDGFVLVRSTPGGGGSRYETIGAWRAS